VTEIRAASTTNVTADQLGEWEEVWQRFEMEPNDVSTRLSWTWMCDMLKQVAAVSASRLLSAQLGARGARHDFHRTHTID